jgi:hypothetical protein
MSRDTRAAFFAHMESALGAHYSHPVSDAELLADPKFQLWQAAYAAGMARAAGICDRAAMADADIPDLASALRGVSAAIRRASEDAGK